MKRITEYTITKESIEDQLRAHRFNHCLEITFQDHSGEQTHKLSAGNSDELHVYREAGATYVLSHNPYLDYLGMEAFRDGEKVEDIFLHGEEVRYVLGDRNREPHEIIHRLTDLMFT